MVDPKPKKRRPGCLIALGLIVTIVAGLLILSTVAANAAVAAPATLIVYSPGVTVNGEVAKSGTILKANDTVATDDTGRAVINYGDGSVTRLATKTTIQVTTATLNKQGTIQQVSLNETLGRTLNTVHKLAGGSSFTVHAPNNSAASVRGTVFEVYIQPDGTIVFKAFIDTISVTQGDKSEDVPQGDQALVGSNGTLGAPQSSPNDRHDPFVPEQEAQNAASQGTTDHYTASEGHLQQGQSESTDEYYAGGGDFKVALGYPGSTMGLEVQGPPGSGIDVKKSGPPPVVITIPNAPAGLYHIIVTGLDLPPGGEDFTIEIGEVVPCTPGNTSVGGAVRQAYDIQQLISNFVGSVKGAQVNSVTLSSDPNTNISVNVSGDGSYTGGIGSFSIAGTGVLTAVNGGMYVQITGGKLLGGSVSGQQVADFLAGLYGQNLADMKFGFYLTSMFVCNSNILVLEGHNP